MHYVGRTQNSLMLNLLVHEVNLWASVHCTIQGTPHTLILANSILVFVRCNAIVQTERTQDAGYIPTTLRPRDQQITCLFLYLFIFRTKYRRLH
jgi:uncharacterized membrane protein